MIKINRVWAMSNAETFKIRPIMELLRRYVGDGHSWLDPMAGHNSIAEYTNDIDPKAPTLYHEEAEKWLKSLRGQFAGILFDPPYSYRQISEHYKALNRVVTRLHTSSHFYARVMDAATPLIRSGGLAISFGWTTSHFGKKRGFDIIEILIIAHGSHKNDTLVTVEKKRC